MSAIRCLSHLVCSILTASVQLTNPAQFHTQSSDFFSDMRRDVQEIFKMTPHDKQVMMFSATLSKEIRPVCKKFMQDVISTTLFLIDN